MREKLGTAGGATVGNTTESKSYQTETTDEESNDNADTTISEEDVSITIL